MTTEQDKLDQYFKENFTEKDAYYLVDQKGAVYRNYNGEPVLYSDSFYATCIARILRDAEKRGPHFVVSTLTGQIVYPEGVRWPL